MENLNNVKNAEVLSNTDVAEIDTIATLKKELKTTEKKLKKTKRVNKLLLVIIIILLLLLGGGTAIIVQTLTVQTGLIVTLDVPIDTSKIPDDFDDNTSSIDDAVIDNLNEKLEMNKMCIDMNSKIDFASADAKGFMNIKNNSVNNYSQFVTITLESNGAQIYQTNLIKVGDCITYDTLDVKLPKGTHNCIATFTQVDTTANKICGQASAKIVINIKN